MSLIRHSACADTRRSRACEAGLWASILLAYAGILWYGPMTGVGFFIRYDSILTPLGIGAVFFALARMPGPYVLPALMLLMTSLCGLVLSGIWASGVSDYSLLAGFFPLSDSFTYVDGSIHLLRDGSLSSVASRRPLSPAFEALLLFLWRGNIRGVLSSMVFITALAMTFPVKAMVRTHGWTAGYVMFLSLFLFYRRFIGTALTEHMGLTLGCLAFALLWYSAHAARKPLSQALAGIFVLTLALSARAAAFFVLPSLAVWAGWTWRGSTRYSFRAFLRVCVVAGAGLALNLLVIHFVGTPGSSSMGNFPYVLYGLVHGGNWEKALEDHPELRRLPELDRNKAIYDFALKGLAERPLSLAEGALGACGQMLFSSEGAYSFVCFGLQRSVREVPASCEATEPVRDYHRHLSLFWKYMQIVATFASFLGLSLLALVGIIFLIRFLQPGSGLLFWAAAGILASSTFAPPWASDLMRAYAATMPLMLALPAIGLASLVLLATRRNAAEPSGYEDDSVKSRALLFLSFVILPLLCLSPILFTVHRTEPQPGPDVAQAAFRMLWLVPGSQVCIEPCGMAASWGRCVDADRVRRNMGVLALANPRRAEELRMALSAGDTLALGYDVDTRTVLHLVLDTANAAHMGSDPAWVHVEPVLAEQEVIWWKVRSVSSGRGE